MPPADSATPLGRLLGELGSSVALLSGPEAPLGLSVTQVALWLPGTVPPADPQTLLVHPLVPGSDVPWSLLGRPTKKRPPRVVVVWLEDDVQRARALESGHVIVEAARDADLTVLTADLVRSCAGGDDNASRRLASLQRSLTQALAEPEPLAALTERLSKVCSAAVAIVGVAGKPQHSTAPLPFALLFQEIKRVDVDTQAFDVQGWLGVAVRLADPAVEGTSYGWLLAASRREGFPDSYARSSVQVAAALAEASLRVQRVAVQQDKAVRSALLEQAIALPVVRDDPELAGKIAGLGMGFEDELRLIVVHLQRTRAGSNQVAGPLGDAVSDLLTRGSVSHLLTSRDTSIVALVQASPDTLRRILASWSPTAPPVHVGIGRRVTSVGAVADSYHDALLAIQAQRHRPTDSWVVAYEDFNFATRLFAEVGLERMAGWADEFLAPLEGRQALIEGLDTFFEHDQNINAAAEALNIHHNSLRYRLAKVETELKVNLRDPAAVASVFLALTAQQLNTRGQILALGPSGRRAPRETPVADVDAPSSATRPASGQPTRTVGVALGPDA